MIATTKENSRSFFRFEARIDWHERHRLLKCTLFTSIIWHSTEQLMQSSCRLTYIAMMPRTNVNLDMYNVQHIRIQRWTWPRYAVIIAIPFTSLKLFNSLKSADIRYVCVPTLLKVLERILTYSMPT
jgi:hypothetical protein